MSGPDDRHGSRTSRRIVDELTAAEARGRWLEDEARKMRNQLAALKTQFWTHWIAIAEPEPGQRCGTPLTNVIITKGLSMPTVALSIVNYENLASGGWLVTAQGWVEGAARKACERLGGLMLTEMHNKGLRPAGEVRSCRLEGGTARLVARIGAEAEAVVAKIRHRVFPMIEIVHDGAGAVLDVSLVDRPQDPDALAKHGKTVLAKLYKGDPQVKKWEKRLRKAQALAQQAQLPQSAEAALAEVDRTRGNYANALQRVDSDRMATKAAMVRAEQQIGVEMVKAAQRRPVAHGDAGLVNFLRHGRP
jgi:hypothetical protein